MHFSGTSRLTNKQRNQCVLSHFCYSESIHAEKAAGAFGADPDRFTATQESALR
jgi:hypothetical protein